MHPFGKGRHSWWGIQMYDATLWIVGPRWSTDPHALDLEPSRAVSADALLKTAIDEMRLSPGARLPSAGSKKR